MIQFYFNNKASYDDFELLTMNNLEMGRVEEIEEEQGYMSSISGITLKNDPERIRGTRGKLVLWEEGGKFPGLLDAWRIEQPSVETDDGVAFGLMVAYGTGGTEGASFTGLKELFYKPEAYNVLAFPNIWDDNAEQTNCGFFVPSWSNLESFDKDGNYIYMDKDGNSIREKAIENLIEQLLSFAKLLIKFGLFYKSIIIFVFFVIP